MIDEALTAVIEEYEQTLNRMGDPAVLSDQRELARVGRRVKQLEPVVEVARRILATREDRDAARDLLVGAEGEDRAEVQVELAGSEALLADLEEQMNVLLLPRDPNEDRDVLIEIRGAEGGEEANLWARNLYDMYTRFADRRGWKHEVLSLSESDMGGIAEVTFKLAGDGAWARMKHEAGPHRVQRVPVTESQGRIHTSSATVTAMPEAEEVDVHLDDKDLKFDVYRSSGPGGQSVNTTDSAVRITHLPTGLVVSMQDQKSQLQNKAKGLLVLRSRLLKLQQDEQAAESSATRRSQVGGGGRGEKIRTYNYKENRVTDHRIGLTTYTLSKVLEGDLDEISDAMVADERARLLGAAKA
ncbi:MAG TPA: peptide chain release factor 1 [Acidimicrobiales bacterium]|nr:peptide chain release factor 1 [Acidimicrobiales bacterium]